MGEVWALIIFHPKSAEYLSKVEKESLFLFATHAAGAGSEHAIHGMEVAKSLAPESDILGTYSCQGEASPKILEKASKKPQPPVWLADAPKASGHPNLADIEVLSHQISKLFARYQAFYLPLKIHNKDHGVWSGSHRD